MIAVDYHIGKWLNSVVCSGSALRIGWFPWIQTDTSQLLLDGLLSNFVIRGPQVMNPIDFGVNICAFE